MNDTLKLTSVRPPAIDRPRGAVLRPALALAAALACSTASAIDYVGTVIVENLNNPRGLAFGSDGGLYIAEAGIPLGDGPTTVIRGTTNTLTNSGSVTRWFNGEASRVLMGLPSLYAPSGETSGPNDVTFGSDGTMYVTVGAGFDPNARTTDLAPDGAGLGTIQFTGGSYDVAGHEAANNPAGGPVDSNPWRTVAHAGGLLVTDAGANALLNVAPNGTITTVATFPGRDIGGGFPSDAVPTGLAVGPNGNYFVGQLSGFPFTPGSSQIYEVEPDGDTTVFATGFTHISGMAFGADGSLYVLELDSNGLMVPGDGGALIRVAANGTKETIFSDGLVNPLGLAIGEDGAFYVSNFGTSSGGGQVLRIAPVPEPETYALMLGGLALVGFAARRRARR